MFDKEKTAEKIQEIYRRAIEEDWPFPYIFNSLKSIGIERYEVDVLTCEIKYVGGATSIKEPPPEGFTPLTIGARFDVAALKHAIERLETRAIPFVESMAEMAAAGVSFYRVDMRPRTVTYHGAGKKDKYVENVPET